jgi:F-type H+-transporting ATPase subunit delta
MKQLDLARPYATAAFEYAKSHQAFDMWQIALSVLAQVVQANGIKSVIAHPAVGHAQAADLLIAAVQKVNIQSDAVNNFIRTVAHFGRVFVLPEVCMVFESYVAAEKNTIHAEVQSAMKLTAKQQKQIQTALESQYDQSVAMTCHVDPALIGGIKIQVGDWVLDNTLKSRLTRLSHTLGDQQ